MGELQTDIHNGLEGNDFDERDAYFGSNYKPPPTRTRKSRMDNVTAYCKFFCAAMNDLMLKVLIVCAIISITVSMIFEEDHRETGKFKY